jgi:hypothetical protein
VVVGGSRTVTVERCWSSLGRLLVPAAALAGLTLSAVSAAATASAANRPASASAAHHAVVCQRRRGHTILKRGVVRVFKAAGPIYPAVFGCVKGSTRAVLLWEVTPGPGPGPETTGSVKQVAGRFIAVETSTSNQYDYEQGIEVFDLRSGASYAITGMSGSVEEAAGLEPSRPQPPTEEAYVLAPDGRTAALYATYPAPATASGSSSPTATGQLVEVLGFHDFHAVLATTGPNVIPPASLAFNGTTVTWTQDGEQRSASA